MITEVAKEQGIKPSRPLSTAVVAAQIGITASPISAAVVYRASSVMEPMGVSYLHLLLMILLPSTFVAIILMSFIVSWLFDDKLANDPSLRNVFAEGVGGTEPQ